jgi:hypothetical protein
MKEEASAYSAHKLKQMFMKGFGQVKLMFHVSARLLNWNS